MRRSEDGADETDFDVEDEVVLDREAEVETEEEEEDEDEEEDDDDDEEEEEEEAEGCDEEDPVDVAVEWRRFGLRWISNGGN